MYTTVGRLSSYISQGVYTVSGPFHPFGGAVDIIVVEQQDGSFKCTPWYVKFGKFQGVLKRREKTVTVAVNDVDASFHMYLDHKGEAYFLDEQSPYEGDQEVPAIEYHKAEQDVSQDEGAKEQPESDSKEETSDDEEDENTQLRPLVASSTLLSVEKVVESESGSILEVCEKTEAVEEPAAAAAAAATSSVPTEVIEDRYLVKAVGSSQPDDVKVQINEVEEQARGFEEETGTTREVPYCSETTIHQEMAWKSVLVKSASLLKEAPIKSGQNLDKLDGAEKKTWGWWGWRGTSSGLSKQGSSDSKLGSSDNKQGSLDLKLQNGPTGAAEQLDVNSFEDAKEKVIEDEGTKLQKPSRSILGMMFGASGKERPQLQDQGDSPRSVVKLLEDKWSIGNCPADGVKWGSEKCNGDASHHLDTSDFSGAEVVLISGDGHVVVAKQDGSSPREDHVSVYLEVSNDDATASIVTCKMQIQERTGSTSDFQRGDDVFKSCLALPDLVSGTSEDEQEQREENAQEKQAQGFDSSSGPDESSTQPSTELDFELSLCRHLLKEGMGVSSAAQVFYANKVSYSKFKSSGGLPKDDSLVVRVGGEYYSAAAAATVLFGLLAFGKVVMPASEEAIRVEAPERVLDIVPKSSTTHTPSGGWKLWPFVMRRPKTAVSREALLVAAQAAMHNPLATGLMHTNGYYRRSWKVRTLIPTSAQLASLNLRKGNNKITFTFTTRVLGKQQVDARIYLWKWNTKVVLSDVDGTITKSDVLGQVMPLVGRDWTQTGVTRLFSAIKDNGYELMFLSARAISQAYLTRQFLVNLKQDGEALPDGPVVISPDGLFPSLYREVIRRAPHEFKIACLEDIKALFPSETQPFYAGFGNRETDEISYLKVGIPKGKIFIINPKGEVIVNNFLDLKSYASLHKLVNDMFPPVHMTEREDFNSWNFWRVPLPQIDDL